MPVYVRATRSLALLGLLMSYPLGYSFTALSFFNNLFSPVRYSLLGGITFSPAFHLCTI